MTSQDIRIMYYDEAHKEWVIDTMDVSSENIDQNEVSQRNENSSDNVSEK